MNVGASKPEDGGLYFSWGNSPGHIAGSGYDFSLEVYNESPGAAIETDLALAEDMARLTMGTPWRLPTAAEFQELFDNCTSVFYSLNGLFGRLFTSNVNGKSIFFRAAGYYNGTSLEGRGSIGNYWSSSYDDANNALCLDFGNAVVNPQKPGGRHLGFVVRAVAAV